MVLVDTSIWVAHFRRSNALLENLLHDGSLLGHDLIVGELACNRLRCRQEILSLLQALPATPVVAHEELLYFIEEKRLRGAGIGYVDAHLLASAQATRIPLWTLDSRLTRVAAKLELAYPAVRR